jgi:hypothetical protein
MNNVQKHNNGIMAESLALIFHVHKVKDLNFCHADRLLLLFQ